MKARPEAECDARTELVHALQLALGVALIQRTQRARDLGRDIGPLQRQLVDARIEDVVEQQRLRDHAFGKKRAIGEHAGDAPSRIGLLIQQGQVRRSPRHGLDQAKQAQQARHGRHAASRRVEQLRHETLDAARPSAPTWNGPPMRVAT